MAEPDAAGNGERRSFLSLLIEWLIVTLIAGGVGVALAAAHPPPPDPPPADKPPPGRLATEKRGERKTDAALACASAGPALIDLPPIVTNIANPADTWIRLEAAMVFDAKALPHPEIVAAEIATDELAYLRTVGVADLQGPIGLENIRQDLRDRALVRSSGHITDLLIKTLVLQ